MRKMMVEHKPIGFKTARQGVAIVLLAGAIGLTVNLWRPGGIPLVGDWSSEAQLTLDSGERLGISLEDAEKLFFLQKALFLDARPRELYEIGHIEGALSLPIEDFEERFEEVLSVIPHDALLITYCDGEGCVQSHELTLALRDRGYSNVRILVGGWRLWLEAQLPVGEGTSATSLGR